MDNDTLVIVLVVRNTPDNDTLTVSVEERVIGTVLEDAPGVWIARPPVAIFPRHATLEAAVRWLLTQRQTGAAK